MYETNRNRNICPKGRRGFSPVPATLSPVSHPAEGTRDRPRQVPYFFHEPCSENFDCETLEIFPASRGKKSGVWGQRKSVTLWLRGRKEGRSRRPQAALSVFPLAFKNLCVGLEIRSAQKSVCPLRRRGSASFPCDVSISWAPQVYESFPFASARPEDDRLGQSAVNDPSRRDTDVSHRPFCKSIEIWLCE